MNLLISALHAVSAPNLRKCADSRGSTALHHACAMGNLQIVSVLLEADERLHRCLNLQGDSALVEAAVRNVEGLVAGRDEIDRGGPSFTADTLQGLARKFPGADLFTIVGDDAAAGLPSWERVDHVVAQSQLVVVDRPGVSIDLPKQFEWLRVESPRLEVSSTDLRSRFADGRPTDYLVTAPVLNEIQIRGMYGSGERIIRS